jgi:hypothetical protein
VARTKGGPNRERVQQGFAKLLSAVGSVEGQAKRFSREIAEGVKQSTDVMRQAALEGLRKELDTIVPRVPRHVGGDRHHLATRRVGGGRLRGTITLADRVIGAVTSSRRSIWRPVKTGSL